MLHRYFHAVLVSQMPGQLLRHVNRTMLAAGASERDHQVLETALLIIGHAGIHQRSDTRQELARALLLLQIFDHRLVFSCERLEALFASGIGNAASVKDE